MGLALQLGEGFVRPGAAPTMPSGPPARSPSRTSRWTPSPDAPRPLFFLLPFNLSGSAWGVEGGPTAATAAAASSPQCAPLPIAARVAITAASSASPGTIMFRSP
jgi:hypothetical protein